MFTKKISKWKSLFLPFIAISLALSACATPTPEVIEKVVTEIVKEVVKETVVVEGTPQVVEKEVTKVVEKEVTRVVEKVVTPTPEPGKTLVIRNRGEIVNLDSHLSQGNPDAVINENIYSRLVFTLPGARDKLVNDLATDWSLSDDGLEYTFHLRKGVQWHKGYGEVTAKDVVWTINRVKDPDLGSRFTGEYAGVVEVVAVDDYTVKIVLAEPNPTFPYTVLARTGYILNQQAIEEKGSEYTSDPVGSGPYIFESWTRGDQCVLVKNPGHWLHEGNVDKAIFKFIGDDVVSELALRSGDLDMAYLETPETQRAAADNPNLFTIVRAAPRTHIIFFADLDNPDKVTSDVRVRQALALAIDRKLIAERAMSGMGRPAYSMLNPQVFGFVDTEFFPYDPEKAKELLAEAGHADGLKLDFLAMSAGINPDIAAVVQAQWKENLGVEAELTVLERALYTERRKAHDFDTMKLSVAREDPEPAIYPYLTSDGIPYPNVAMYTGIDDLIVELKPEADYTVRAELYQKIQARLAEDVPIIPLVYPSLVLAMRKGIEPFEPTIWHYPLWRMQVTD